MKLTYYGHACFGLEIDGISILLDPFISPNPLAKHIDINTIKADYILLSHGHEDHLADALYLAKKNDSIIVSNFEIVSWYSSKGHAKGHPMNIGGKKDFGAFSVKYVNAIHSSVLPDGSYGGNPGGFLIKAKEQCIYFSGDTALSSDMKILGEFEKIDLAILPIGDNFTMGIEDASIAAQFINCNKVIGMHFNTFPYIEIDTNYAVNYFKERKQELILVEIGENLDI
jgi:L-ascorbate metabolism protein UlaG (beta-lactamase superfamily)